MKLSLVVFLLAFGAATARGGVKSGKGKGKSAAVVEVEEVRWRDEQWRDLEGTLMRLTLLLLLITGSQFCENGDIVYELSIAAFNGPFSAAAVSATHTAGRGSFEPMSLILSSNAL